MKLTTQMGQTFELDKIEIVEDQEVPSKLRIDLIREGQVIEQYVLSVIYNIQGNFYVETSENEYENCYALETGYNEEGEWVGMKLFPDCQAMLVDKTRDIVDYVNVKDIVSIVDVERRKHSED